MGFHIIGLAVPAVGFFIFIIGLPCKNIYWCLFQTGPVRLFVPYKRRKRDSNGSMPVVKKRLPNVPGSSPPQGLTAGAAKESKCANGSY